MFPRDFAHPRGPAVAPRLPKSFDSVPREAARVPGWHVCTSRPTPHGPGSLKTSQKRLKNSQPKPTKIHNLRHFVQDSLTGVRFENNLTASPIAVALPISKQSKWKSFKLEAAWRAKIHFSSFFILSCMLYSDMHCSFIYVKNCNCM